MQKTVVTPYKNNTGGKKEQVITMFNNIAHRYDFLNEVLSLGIHKLWRKKAISLLASEKPKSILDVATGTGDFAIEALKLSPNKITGIDVSEKMLEIGKEKIKRKNIDGKIELIKGDSENLLFEENTFDAITVGFGVRNFENLEKGLSEMFRILKPGGTMVILEFSKPMNFPIKNLYNFYFRHVCPFIGKLFSKDNSAYSYLYESVNTFPEGNNFVNILKKIGLTETKMHPLTFSIATIYTGKK